MSDDYLCRCCNHNNVPKNERGPGFIYHPYYGGYLCENCRRNHLKPHTDHPLWQYDRTCPACNPSERGLHEDIHISHTLGGDS